MNVEKPLVSVLMPNYNCEKYLSEAIESILNQTYKNFEFIILDDCSTDNSWNIIQKYAKKDKRIRAFKNEKNLKIVKTRNKLFSLISNESKYTAIFDSDDISLPQRFEKQVLFLENNSDYGIVGSNLLIIDEKSNGIGKRSYKPKFNIKDKSILIKSPLAQPSVLIRKKALERIGLKYSSDSKFDRARDFDMWVKIGDFSKIKNIQQPLLKYRISTTQGKTTHLKETIKSTLQVQRKWYLKKRYISFRLLIYMFLEYVLLLLPNKFILYLFKKLIYKK